MSATDDLRRMLDERGIEHDDYDPDPRYSGPTSDRKTEWDGASFREWPNGTIRFGAKGTTPAQAVAATVGVGIWEPSKEWKVWHESLRHAKPANIRDVVEEILFDAIEFGGDMGPNGNVWSGVDEGIVLTEGCIDGWVKSIESIAATVGAGTCHLEECEHEREIPYDLQDCDGGWYTEVTHDCDECGYENVDPNIRFCGGCGRKIRED